MDEASLLDALQEIYSRSLAEELDRSGRRYRLHALVRQASGATDALRLKHAKCVENEFQNWESGWLRCEEDLADWRAAFAWALGRYEEDDAWKLASDLASRGYSLTERLGRLPEAHEICEQVIQKAGQRRDLEALQVGREMRSRLSERGENWRKRWPCLRNTRPSVQE